MPMQPSRRLPRSVAKMLVAAALTAFVALQFGCGKSERAQQGQSAAKASVPRSGDESFARPVDLPNDVPVLKNSTLKAAISQGDRTVVHLYTTTPVKDATSFYSAALKSEGWTVDSVSSGADMSVVSAKKGKMLCGV